MLIDLIETELVGPKNVNEVLLENPQHRYIIGQLAPRSPSDVESGFAEELSPRDDDQSADSNETSAEEEDTSSSITAERSESLNSIGISFVVQPGAIISVECSWGEYRRSDSSGISSYQREQLRASIQINFDGPSDLTRSLHGRAEISWVARAIGDHLIGSIFFTNASVVTKDGTDRFYQASFELKAVLAERPFLNRDIVIRKAMLDAEDLLFRNRREYGAGLHTAVSASGVDETSGTARLLRTMTMPRAETWVTTPLLMEDPDALSMRRLSAAESRHSLSADLRKSFEPYVQWANLVESSLGNLDHSLMQLGRQQVGAIRERIARLNAGLDLIAAREDVFQAFLFANEAMARARFRQDNPRKSLDVPWPEAMAGSWRPFQLAFLLSQLTEMVDPRSSLRANVDVLFFPTGGGKTEAYLGLAAFTMAWRRIAGAVPYGGAGSTILMRYTLRLLTTQQFSRATSLIAAAELMRTHSWRGGILGSAPFSAGLWVGPMTPSTVEEAKGKLRKARSAHNKCSRECALSKAEKEIVISGSGEGSDTDFLVLTECPWCAVPLCIESVVITQKPGAVSITCPNVECPFGATGQCSKLPIWFVDSDVYRECPTLLIGTVDKFATLPYRGEAKSLFGNVKGYCSSCGFYSESAPHAGGCSGEKADAGRARSFDLIIQDELHTVTDNIGSVFGLYESVVDFLIGLSGPKPKYIAATATIKNVDRQVDQLFGGRSAAVFPPSGLDAGETFFSRDLAPSASQPGRTYVGIYAPTKSRLTTFVSCLSSILAAAWEVAEKCDLTEADPYLTLVGYFNTIRDLGAVKSLLADDIPPVMDRISTENAWPKRELQTWEDEMTGRIGSGEVPQRLALLSTPFGGEGTPCDFMACTNMISVGVDVQRLGLMIVDGQPKSTSEYIQATSRVGRSSPGIVFVVYNAMRPRDVSHYEHFNFYHLSYYRFVEGGSVTPFSDGCISRYLPGAYIAGYRLSDADSRDNSADRFKEDLSGRSEELATFVKDRARGFGLHEETSATQALDSIISTWALCTQHLRYARPSLPANANNTAKAAQLKGPRPVIMPPEDRGTNKALAAEQRALFMAPRSMRNVEPTVPLKVATRGD